VVGRKKDEEEKKEGRGGIKKLGSLTAAARMALISGKKRTNISPKKR
jgi:hypothetical protein